MLNCNGKVTCADAHRYLQYAAERSGDYATMLSVWLLRVQRDGLMRADIDTLELIAGELDLMAEQLSVVVRDGSRGESSRAR